MQYRIKKEELNCFCTRVCKQYGYSDENAAIVAQVLTETDMMGTFSHGTKNLLNYMNKTQAGGIRVDADIHVIKEGTSWALMDGDAGLGMLTSYRAMEKAIEKAGESGIALVTIRNSSHFGAAGYYACMAAKKGMIGICMGNTDPNMCIPGGKGREIGNSPLSIAVPQKDGNPMFLDIALSAVAALKVEQADKDGKSIPPTWIVDKDGFPSTNPTDYMQGGAAQPMAGHKGYGLSVMVEILTGVLSGGAILHEMTSWLWDLTAPNHVSHSFIAIDVSKFMDLDQFENRVQTYTDAIHNTPKREGSTGIFLPGEMENQKYTKANVEGILLPEDVVQNHLQLAELCKIDIHMEEES